MDRWSPGSDFESKGVPAARSTRRLAGQESGSSPAHAAAAANGGLTPARHAAAAAGGGGADAVAHRSDADRSGFAVLPLRAWLSLCVLQLRGLWSLCFGKVPYFMRDGLRVTLRGQRM